jgi:hypothetical protein
VGDCTSRGINSEIPRSISRRSMHEPAPDNPLSAHLRYILRARDGGSAFSAIALSPALPDICGSIEYPENDSMTFAVADPCETWLRWRVSHCRQASAMIRRVRTKTRLKHQKAFAIDANAYADMRSRYTFVDY